MKLAKNQANELLLFENYSHSSSTLSSKSNRTYPENQQKKQLCLNLWDYTINHNENENKNERWITQIRHKQTYRVPDKIEKFSKIGKDMKSLIFSFSWFLTVLTKV